MVQFNHFRKNICFCYFIKKFQRKFYMSVVLLYVNKSVKCLDKMVNKWNFLRMINLTCIIAIQTNNGILQWCRNRGGGGQLTLFQPGRADYPHLLLLTPSKFFTFLHHCLMLTTSFHEKRILNSEFYWFHRFDYFRSEVLFISIWFKRGFCENFLMVKTFVKICGEELN